MPLSLLWARVRGGAPRVDGEQLLALLALLLLLRCVLDPWNTIYYELPFLLALLAWEALQHAERPPVVTLALTAVVVGHVHGDAELVRRRPAVRVLPRLVAAALRLARPRGVRARRAPAQPPRAARRTPRSPDARHL